MLNKYTYFLAYKYGSNKCGNIVVDTSRPILQAEDFQVIESQLNGRHSGYKCTIMNIVLLNVVDITPELKKQAEEGELNHEETDHR